MLQHTQPHFFLSGSMRLCLERAAVTVTYHMSSQHRAGRRPQMNEEPYSWPLITSTGTVQSRLSSQFISVPSGRLPTLTVSPAILAITCGPFLYFNLFFSRPLFPGQAVTCNSTQRVNSHDTLSILCCY